MFSPVFLPGASSLGGVEEEKEQEEEGRPSPEDLKYLEYLCVSQGFLAKTLNHMWNLCYHKVSLPKPSNIYGISVVSHGSLKKTYPVRL